MPEDSLVVRNIDWKSAFPFTLIFKAFRIAIHPSKLVLALVALLLIVIGGRLLDRVWLSAGSGAVPDEISLYAEARGEPNAAEVFHQRRNAIREEMDTTKRLITGSPTTVPSRSEVEARITTSRDEAVKAADETLQKAIDSKPSAEDLKKAKDARDASVAAAYETAAAGLNRVGALEGNGLFGTFYQYQITELHKVVQLSRQANILSKGGAVDELINMLSIAPGWAFRHHYVYFTIFGIYFLVIWAIFGGAISRIAAVQVARDEKISIRQALSFSTAKFLSFVSAPVIPVGIIAIVGIAVAVVGFVLFNIPFLGPIVGGALFFLALAAGFVMTLVLLGLLGGFNLMYPTIAVEGSDSFDAISRSFSYLFARPWRLLFYTAIAAVYGTICYVFIRYFIKLMLALTWYFAGMFVFVDADSTQPLWPEMWSNPLAYSQLMYTVDYSSLGHGQAIGAGLIWFWNSLSISVLGAFAIAFFFSANTIIYVLMRREVDATELDDVYLEQTEDDFVETVTTGAPVVPAPSAQPTATTTEAPISESPAAPPTDTPPPGV